jgi:hypothetical protein
MTVHLSLILRFSFLTPFMEKLKSEVWLIIVDFVSNKEQIKKNCLRSDWKRTSWVQSVKQIKLNLFRLLRLRATVTSDMEFLEIRTEWSINEHCPQLSFESTGAFVAS